MCFYWLWFYTFYQSYKEIQHQTNSCRQWQLRWHYLPIGFPAAEGGSQEVTTLRISPCQFRRRLGAPYRNSNTDSHSRILSLANHQIASLSSGGLPVIIQRDHWKTHAQLLERSNVYILPEGKIPNWTWNRWRQRRPGVSQRKKNRKP